MSELPPGWATATIGDLIGSNGIFRDGDWVETKDQDPEGDVRLTQLADIGDGFFRDRSSRFLTSKSAVRLGCTLLEPADVLIARMPDPLGRACLFPGDPRRCVTAVDVCIVRPGSSSVDPRWLMWWINTPEFRGDISGFQAGTTRKRISRKNLATIEFPVPPPNEQRRIVAAIEEHLSRLDAADASLNGAMRRLAGLRRAALAAVVAGTWPQVAIGDLASDTLIGLDRSRERQSTDPEAGSPYVRMSNIDSEGRMTWGDLTFVGVTSDEEEHFILRTGDLLFNTRNSRDLVGKVGLVGNPPDHAVFNNNLMRIRFRDDVDPGYAWAAMNSPAFRATLDSVKNATTNVAAIYAKNLLRLELPVPPLDEQQRIVAEIEERLGAIDALRAAIERAQRRGAALRRSVLERAFRGELVPQDPSDEPAAALLARIRADREASRRRPS